MKLKYRIKFFMSKLKFWKKGSYGKGTFIYEDDD